ncbi:hypothetical protein AGLY_017686, partial [Aphis glycines]
KEIPYIIRKEQQTQKLNYDKTHKTVSYLPEANKSKKLAYRYRRPFKIIKKISDVNYEIELILNGKSTTDVIHFMILIIASAIAEEKISITISSGAFFNEVPEVIVYEKSIPLIYTQKTIIEEENNVEYLLEVENYCENKKNSYCYINLEKLAEIVGDTTEKQIKNFYTNEDKLKQQADKLRDVFVSDHKDLNQITSQLNNYTIATSNKLENLKNIFKTYLIEEKKNELMENTKTDKEIKGMQEIMFNTLTIVMKIINYERDTSTQIHCKIGKIPPGLMPIDTLHADLQKVSEILRKD